LCVEDVGEQGGERERGREIFVPEKGEGKWTSDSYIKYVQFVGRRCLRAGCREKSLFVSEGREG